MKIPRRPAVTDRGLDRRLAMSYLAVSRATEADEEKIQAELDDITARAAVLSTSRRDRATTSSSFTTSDVVPPESAKTIVQRLKAAWSTEAMMDLLMILGFVGGMVMPNVIPDNEGLQAIVLILIGSGIGVLGMSRFASILLRTGRIKTRDQRHDAKKNPVTDTEDRLTNT
ncbi:hypothetical protein ACU635_59180 [[Actinomadura] parvosata]|uniref:hypothetical protein n=1 Tax=[Actinomadura] parvosata TaxID=1955412 RepID=UPI00406C546A